MITVVSLMVTPDSGMKRLWTFQRHWYLTRNMLRQATIVGVVYGNLGQWDLAIADFSNAISVDREYADAYTNRGMHTIILDSRTRQ